MRIQTMLLPATIAVSLLASTAMIPAAQAQNSAVLSPLTKWAVSKIDQPAAAGGSYCALARQFSQNTVLTFARNQQGESSLALEFQSPRLVPSQAAQVILDPGAGQQRSFNIYPASNRALVVRLGTDEAFFEALNRTGYLRVELGGQNFNFNLSDIAQGTNRLGNCLTTVMAAQTPITPPYSAPASALSRDTSAQVSYEIERLRADVQSMREDNQRLANLLNDRSQPPPLPGADLARLNSRIESLQAENGDLRIQLADAIRQSEQSKASAAGLTDVTALKAENEALRKQIESSSPSSDVLAALEAEIKRLSSENETLAAAASEMQNGSASADMQALESLKSKNADLQKALDAMAQQQADAVKGEGDQTRQMEARLAALETENAALKDSLLKAAEGNSDDAKMQQNLIDSLKQENIELQKLVQNDERGAKQLEEMEGRLSSLMQENEGLKKDLEVALEKAIANDADARAASLQGALDELKAQSAEKDQKLAELSSLMAEHESLKRENESLKTSLRDLQQAGGSEKENLKAQITSLEESRSALQSEIAALKAQGEIRAKESADMGAMEKRFKEAQDEIVRLKAQNDELRVSLDLSGVQEADKAAQASALESALKQGEDLRARIAELESQLQSAKDSQEAMANLEAENARLAALQDRISASSEVDRSEIDALRSENKSLKEQLENAQSSSGDIAELEVKLKAQSEENIQLKASIAEVQQKLAEAEKQIETAQVEQKTAASAAPTENQIKSDAAQAERIRELEDALRQAQSQKQQDMQGLALENMRMKSRIEQLEAVPRRGVQEASVQSQDLPQLGDMDEAAMDRQAEILSEAVMPTAGQTEQVDAQPEVPEQGSADESSGNERGMAKGAASVIEPVTAEDILSAHHASDYDHAREARADEAAKGPFDAQPSLSEAQQYEQALRRQIENPAPAAAIVSEASSAEPAQMELPLQPSVTAQQLEEETIHWNDAPVSEAPAEPLTVSRSEDPFAPIPVSEDPFLAYEAADSGEVKERHASGEAPAGAASVEQEQPDDAFAAFETPAAIPQPVIQTPLAAAASIALDEPQASQTFSPPSGAFALTDMVASADIVAAEAVQRVPEAAAGGGMVAYQWQAQDVFGTGEQRPLTSINYFDENVKEYLSRTQSRCNGDFAVVPDHTSQQGDTRIDTYDVACIGQGVSASASLLFFNKAGTFNVVAHEAAADNMDAAMTLRDKAVAVIRGS